MYFSAIIILPHEALKKVIEARNVWSETGEKIKKPSLNKCRDLLYINLLLDFNMTEMPASQICVFFEYDVDRLNGGVRLRLFNHLNILAGILEFDKFSGGVGINFVL